MSRKVGSGKVKVNGKTMTQKMYEDTVIAALEHNGNNWMTVNQIVLWGSTHKMCEKKDSPRQAQTHPMWKVISTMYETPSQSKLVRKREKGCYMYRLREPEKVYVNDECFILTED